MAVVAFTSITFQEGFNGKAFYHHRGLTRPYVLPTQRRAGEGRITVGMLAIARRSSADLDDGLQNAGRYE
jgi:hypothetical protein